MSKRENFYRRDPGLFLAGAATLSLEERGAYNTIIDLLYLTWRPIEDNRAYIAGHCMCAVQKLNPILNRLISKGKLICFEEGGQSYISNDKFEDERNSVKGAQATRSGRGKVREKSGEVGEKSASVSENEPLLDTESTGKQSVAPLEKSREDKTDAKASLVAKGDAAKAFEEWNALAKRLALPMAKDLTPARRKAINARLAASGLAGWREALSAVEASPHCRGENDRGWRADIDFVASAAKFQKLREGSYGPVTPAGGGEASAPTFDAPQVRASIVGATDDAFARSYVDHYCRWMPGRRIEVCNDAVAKLLNARLSGWAERHSVTIAVASANDGAGQAERERAA